MEYTVINYLFDKGETVSEGICFTSQSIVTGLLRLTTILSRTFTENEYTVFIITYFRKRTYRFRLVVWSGHFGPWVGCVFDSGDPWAFHLLVSDCKLY